MKAGNVAADEALDSQDIERLLEVVDRVIDFVEPKPGEDLELPPDLVA